MNWWGKAIGTTLGFALYGPAGAIAGALLGHAVDSNASPAGLVDLNSIQHSFFDTLFSVMGHLAKADGRVSVQEIAVVEGIMQRMRLNQAQRRRAIELFNTGKNTGFQFARTVEKFHRICGVQPQLLRIFVEFLLDAALADGGLRPEGRRILLVICRQLRIPDWEFERLVRMRQNDGAGSYQASQGRRVTDPYQVLGVERDANERQIKQAYRRLISQHHPDKLVSKGLPKEMMELAKEKTREIRAAYEKIREIRGFR